MAIVPAICDKCGTVFGSPNVIGGTASKVTFVRSKVGPCPRCGGMGSIPDGVYDLMDDTLKVVRTANIPAAKLQRVLDVLQQRARGRVTDLEVIERIKHDAPALAPTVNTMFQRPNATQWLMLLIAVISLCLQLTRSTPDPPSAEEIVRALHQHPIPVQVQQDKTPAGHKAGNVKSTKRKRPPKQYGKAKRRRKRR